MNMKETQRILTRVWQQVFAYVRSLSLSVLS